MLMLASTLEVSSFDARRVSEVSRLLADGVHR
ncbi:hypothetical protein SAMN05443572_114226 [Myxococcus fulvus]|uniref:Uncharacterized protein n=1 Tax=Myxococcus fulvus TaxID=33 RepID=A0ABY1CWC9_MYXFU|nr:hypothetical protein SAMN05443572_114226 [Myxococcus fulvus]